MINVNELQEIENGIKITDDQGGDVGPVLTGGVDSPIGLDLPEGSLYLRTNGETWRKSGAGINDWSTLSFGQDENIDGGFANAVYLPSQNYDGGGA